MLDESQFPYILVVDASVAAKWYLPEELSEEAAGFLEAGVSGDKQLIAPSLLEPELGNVLWHRHRRGDITLDRLREIWSAFGAAPLEFFEPGPLMPAALEIAVGYGCTVYDTLYVALAASQQGASAVMLTADRRLVSRLGDTPFAGRVRLLEPRSG